jgi:UDP:flavonoid glycosyltransferase YjiC (YdhE family)
MKFVVASHGSRGDVEPCVAVGRELVRRGHDVHMVVPPDLVDFVESAGPTAIASGVNMQGLMELYRKYWEFFFRNPWKIQELNRLGHEVGEPVTQSRVEVNTAIMSLADGADLLITGLIFEEQAANVAEYHDIPLATLHFFPMRANGQLLPFLPSPLGRSAMTAFWWLYWRGTKKVEDAQREELGLTKAIGSSTRRMAERGSLEIQAYDDACFPGLAAEWTKFNGRQHPQRPFVGTLTLELPTDADDEAASWIAAGTPPIYFGFGSMPVADAAEMLAMISAACAQLGERALICSGWSDFTDIPQSDHVKVVGAVNHAAAFPACRAVVHHGGAGTTAAGLRAGVPSLILYRAGDQPLWGAAVKRLKVGATRRFVATTQESLVADLRTVLAPQYVARARDLGARMTKPAESVSATADLVEDLARRKRGG